ncbi:MAG: Uma2 family endonuclease [Elainellaceae cyanobacterium]
MTKSEANQVCTFETYLTLDQEQRSELVDGELIMMNPPNLEHFLITKFIEQTLDAEIERLQQPWMCFREAGVRTTVHHSRIADVCVVTLDQAKALSGISIVFQTPPLLAVEVISLDTVKRDYRYKRSEYAALGIPEYWIVDPLHSRVIVLDLNEGLYDEREVASAAPVQSKLFQALNLRAADLLGAGAID